MDGSEAGIRKLWEKLKELFKKSADDVREGASEEIGREIIDGLGSDDQRQTGGNDSSDDSQGEPQHDGLDYDEAVVGEGRYYLPDGESGNGRYLEEGGARYWDSDFDGDTDFVEVQYATFSGYDYDNDGYVDATGGSSYWGD